MGLGLVVVGRAMSHLISAGARDDCAGVDEQLYADTLGRDAAEDDSFVPPLHTNSGESTHTLKSPALPPCQAPPGPAPLEPCTPASLDVNGPRLLSLQPSAEPCGLR